jgi:hypothetical protein
MQNQHVAMSRVILAVVVMICVLTMATFVVRSRHDPSDLSRYTPGTVVLDGTEVSGWTVTGEMITKASAAAPFDEARRPPADRYEPSQGDGGDLGVQANSRFVLPQLDVMGTVAGSSVEVAVVRRSGERPRVVSVGDTFGAFVLSAVRPREVVLTASGVDVIQALVEPSPTPTALSRNDTLNPPRWFDSFRPVCLRNWNCGDQTAASS